MALTLLPSSRPAGGWPSAACRTAATRISMRTLSCWLVSAARRRGPVSALRASRGHTALWPPQGSEGPRGAGRGASVVGPPGTATGRRLVGSVTHRPEPPGPALRSNRTQRDPLSPVQVNVGPGAGPGWDRRTRPQGSTRRDRRPGFTWLCPKMLGRGSETIQLTTRLLTERSALAFAPKSHPCRTSQRDLVGKSNLCTCD